MLEKTILLHGSSGQPHLDEGNPHVGMLGAGGFSVHSFFDGIAIGVAFQASTAVGITVAAAVIAHDFSDGLNTVSVLLKNNASEKTSYRWLFIDAITPFLGALSTLLYRVPESWLALILAGFAGFFIYVGASDLLPEAHEQNPPLVSLLTTLGGFALIFGIVQVL